MAKATAPAFQRFGFLIRILSYQIAEKCEHEDNWLRLRCFVCLWAMAWPIRRLLTADAQAFRELRLEALQMYPDSFGSTYETEATKPLDYFIERLEKNSVFGGFDGQKLAGVIGFYQQSGPKDKHKGVIWGMYVKPRLHGSGLAPALLKSVIELAKTQVEQIQLTVVTNNQRAIRFYEAAGFCPYGVEKNALKTGEHYFDELLMVRFLI